MENTMEKQERVILAGVHRGLRDVLSDTTKESIKELKELATHPKVVAVGEIGLDFYYDNSPREQQRRWFKRQLDWAAEVNLPVIIHSREAAQECFNMIKSSKVRRGVIHCYSGSVEMAQEYIKMGYWKRYWL